MEETRTKLLQIVVTPDEHRFVGRLARSVGLSRSAFMRRAVVLAADRLDEVKAIPMSSRREAWRTESI